MTAPDSTPTKLALCEVLTLGGIIYLDVAVPASLKSTAAEVNIVTPTPIALNTALVDEPFTPTPGNATVVDIPTWPTSFTNTLFVFDIKILTKSRFGFSPTANLLPLNLAAVAIPAMLNY